MTEPLPKHGRCRRSIRLRDFDYARAGAYSLTICAKDRACLFGNVEKEAVRLNDAGKMVERWWRELNRKFPNVETDEYVVMPNHFHGILVIDNLNNGDAETENERDGEIENGVPTIVQWFKTMTTNEYIRGVKSLGWPAFPGKLWQRNYYEHIIRNDVSLERMRQYIADNPAKWALDRENPAFVRQNEFEYNGEPGNENEFDAEFEFDVEYERETINENERDDEIEPVVGADLRVCPQNGPKKGGHIGPPLRTNDEDDCGDERRIANERKIGNERKPENENEIEPVVGADLRVCPKDLRVCPQIGSGKGRTHRSSPTG